MSTEGDRRPRVLENNYEQHIGLPHTETETSESPSDIHIDTQGSIRENLNGLLVFCLGLLICCFVFISVIFSLIKFIGELSDNFVSHCGVNSTYDE